MKAFFNDSKENYDSSIKIKRSQNKQVKSKKVKMKYDINFVDKNITIKNISQKRKAKELQNCHLAKKRKLSTIYKQI